MSDYNDDIKGSEYVDDTVDEVPFWSDNPNILFNAQYVMEFFPTCDMTYNQKMNALTRCVIVASIIVFAVSPNVRTLLVVILTIASIFGVHHYKIREAERDTRLAKEGYENIADDILEDNNIVRDANTFDEPTSKNPFGNVLVSDYEDNVNKKPAPPAFNDQVNDNILEKAKNMVAELNPDQPDIADKLFKDLGEQYVFEQSLRPFTSNPSTTIVNDQKGFADFCYGSMSSCKEGNLFACARNLPRHRNY
jgi:hypothetical protein